ncbi:MAG: PAS domain S-box protein [Sterolibacteriaceae bacterium]|nr:PAS domain S-box protein [Sterolibacteriaceae bacterium]
MAKRTAKPKPAPAPHPPRRFLVGIGSSAGGLEALTALFSNLPTDLNIPYVVAQHLSPTYRSMLAQLIGRETAMTVKEVEHGETLVGNTVYIAPANHNVVVRKGKLDLLPPDPGVSVKPSVNLFFHSLAEEYKEDAVAVVLSGTGSDGSSGVRAIKAEGGFAFAQAPNTAKYDGMPQAAISTGHVDWILPPDRIAEEIAVIVRTHGTLPTVQKLDGESPSTLKSLLARLRERTRLDFSSYKETTLLRRIERRMAANRVKTLEEYMAVIGREANELDRLANDILISVTAFFRDPQAFEKLGDALVQRVDGKKPGEEIRVWVPGCATGEEVYTIALLLSERLGARMDNHPIQLFATDVDLNAMAVARRAVYPASAVTGLSRERVARCFNVRGDSYEVVKSLRDMVVFARQDLVQDPPFLRLDLVSCRNVLIYFQNSLQSRVMEIFHYALKDAGILFLGKSETVSGQQTHMFETVNREARLFARKGRSLRIPPPFSPTTPLQPMRLREERKIAPPPEQILTNILGDAYAPPAVLVDRNLSILAVRGDAGRFLKFPSGRPELNLLACLPKPLRADAQVMAQQALQRKDKSIGRTHRLKDASGEMRVRLALIPLANDHTEACLAVAFETLAPASETVAEAAPTEGRFKELEDELLATREHLQTVIEEQEASNEELQALNEELQASNEEMQASNEELQASNEELQSTNEELSTVNDELAAKNLELDRLSVDLSSVLDTIGFPVLVIDDQLLLIRFNEAAARLLRLGSEVLGKHFNRVELPSWAAELSRYVSALFGRRAPRALDLNDGTRHFSLASYAYRIPSEELGKAVVCLVDTTQADAAARALSDQQDQLMAILNNSADAIRLLDAKGTPIFANDALFSLLGLARRRRDNGSVMPRVPTGIARQWRKEDRKALKSSGTSQVEECLQIGDREVVLETRRIPILDEDGEIRLLCATSSDVTERRRAETQLRLAAQVFEASGEAIMITDGAGIIISVNPAFTRITGYAPNEVIGHTPRILSSRQQDKAFYRKMWKTITETGRWTGEIWNRRKNGEVFPEWVSISTIASSDTATESHAITSRSTPTSRNERPPKSACAILPSTIS